MKKLFNSKMACSVLVVMLAVFMSSCKQDSISPSGSPSQATETLPTKFQIDGQEVTKEGFFKQLLPSNQVGLRDVTTDMTIIANAYRVLGESGKVVGKQSFDIINVFSSDDEFYKYADANNHPNERVYDYVESNLADYAISSGAVESFETIGKMPKSYIDYMDAFLIKNGFEPSTQAEIQPRTLFSQVYKGCNLTESSFPIRHNPWLGMIGYNDNISSFSPIGLIGGRSDIFDQSFFRKRIAGLWYWSSPGTKFDFCSNPWGFLNDRATSWSIF